MNARADELFACYVEHLVVEGQALAIDELAAGDAALRASLLERLQDFKAVEAALGRRLSDVEGETIGPYRVLEKLGSGGMGEVYRARDERIGREVALKLLPPLFAFDRQRRARFEREARLLAALSHPNIEAIYGVETSGGRTCLVLELIAGETLADRLKRGPVPVPEALGLLDEVAAGLAAAHATGILHRDLKPANVQITPEGHARILDFSLGKHCGAGDGLPVPASVSRRAPTITGMVLGTASYMSPEQARGRALDQRTDVWSFGCLLFEALTGRRAFPGDTFTDAVARVIRREPDWRSLPASVPPEIRRLIRHCLEKDEDQRLGSLGPARSEIADALANGTARRRRGSLRTALTAFAVLAAIASQWEASRERPPVPPPLAAPMALLPSARGPTPKLDLAAYRASLAAAYSRWRESSLGRAAAGPGTSLVYFTTLAPPKIEIASALTGAVIARAPLPEGVVRATTPWVWGINRPTLTPDGSRLYMATWPDGDRVFVLDTRSRRFLTVPDGTGIRVEARAGPVAVTPDGRRGYVSHVSGHISLIDTDPTSATYHQRLAIRGSPALRYSDSGGTMAVSPDGTRLYALSPIDGISVFDIDPRSPTFHTRVSVPDGSAIALGRGLFGYLAFAPDGSRLFGSSRVSDEVWGVDTQRGSRTLHRVVTRAAAFSEPLDVVITPDGSLAYVVGKESTTVMTLDTATGTFVFEPIHVGVTPTSIALTPDGTRAFVANGTSLTLSVIDTDPRSATFRQVVATVPTGAWPGVAAVGRAP